MTSEILIAFMIGIVIGEIGVIIYEIVEYIKDRWF